MRSATAASSEPGSPRSQVGRALSFVRRRKSTTDETAAIKVQSVWRGKQTRQTQKRAPVKGAIPEQSGGLLPNNTTEEHSAKAVQRIWRGHRIRRASFVQRMTQGTSPTVSSLARLGVQASMTIINAPKNVVKSARRRTLSTMQQMIEKRLMELYRNKLKLNLIGDRRMPWHLRCAIHEGVDMIWTNLLEEVVRFFDKINFEDDLKSPREHTNVPSAQSPPPSPPSNANERTKGSRSTPAPGSSFRRKLGKSLGTCGKLPEPVRLPPPGPNATSRPAPGKNGKSRPMSVRAPGRIKQALQDFNDCICSNYFQCTYAIKLHSASNLLGKSDPYGVIDFGRFRRISSTLKDTLDPVWQEEFVFKGQLRDLLAHDLLIEIFDADHKYDQSLGHAELDRRHLRSLASSPGQCCDFDLPLSAGGSVRISAEVKAVTRPTFSRVAFMHVAPVLDIFLPIIKEVPQMLISIVGMLMSLPSRAMRSKTSATFVTVELSQMSASGLYDADGGGMFGMTWLGDKQNVSDPYLWLSLGQQEYQTETKHNSLNPVWEEKFCCRIRMGELLADPLRLEVFDQDDYSNDDTLGTAEIGIAELQTLVNTARAGAQAKPTSKQFELPLKISQKKSREQGWIRIHVLIKDVCIPSTYAMCRETLLPLVTSCRNTFLYLRMPYDRGFFAKIRDWRYLVMYFIAASPDVLVRGCFFTVYLACIAHDREEYQLMRFILALKGSQFVSGIIKACKVCIEFWSCTALSAGTVLSSCMAVGPGVGDSVLEYACLYVWLQVLCWLAFLLLPYSGRFDMRTGTISHVRAEQRRIDATADLEKRGLWNDVELRTHRAERDGYTQLGTGSTWHIRQRSLGDGLNYIRNQFLLLMHPQLHGHDHNNRIILLLKWDAIAFAFCTLLFTWMVALAEDHRLQREVSISSSAAIKDSLLGSDVGGAERLSNIHNAHPRRDLRGLVDAGICLNNCSLAAGGYHFDLSHNGVCDDGGQGAQTDNCAVGNDCDDCGPRVEPSPPPPPPSNPPPPSHPCCACTAREEGEQNENAFMMSRIPPKSPSTPPAIPACPVAPPSPLPLLPPISPPPPPPLPPPSPMPIPPPKPPLPPPPPRPSTPIPLPVSPFAPQQSLPSLSARSDSPPAPSLPLMVPPNQSTRFTSMSSSSDNRKTMPANSTVLPSTSTATRWIMVVFGLLNGNAWNSWRAQITFAIIRILFALTAAPFFIFTLGPLHKLFSHSDNTAYTSQGRLVHTDPNGLSAYLSWLRETVLESRLFHDELQYDLPKQELSKLRKAVQEAELFLERAWQRPHSAKREMNKKKAEIDALLSSIVTQEMASDALYTHCFPNQKILQQWQITQDRIKRKTKKAKGSPEK